MHLVSLDIFINIRQVGNGSVQVRHDMCYRFSISCSWQVEFVINSDYLVHDRKSEQVSICTHASVGL